MNIDKNTDLNLILDQIKNLIKPINLILFHKKTGNNGRVVGFKVCIIVDTKSKLDLEKYIYKNIDSNIPFDVILYTSDEWNKLKLKENSFVNQILQKGRIYGQE